ncbi:MAG: tetratricopeptide repeat protein [Candidatus Kapabacteria bacterium]|nr:tetratricopeptide repeat protein [Candidatus Kapabacteria bacterium]MDW8011541.1 tetratricopeptide repeat protein [Bacteroidota bacterium]
MEKQAEQIQREEHEQTGRATEVLPLRPSIGERVVEWLRKRWRIVAIAAAALLVGVGGVIAWQVIQRNQAEEAATLLSRVYSYYDNGDYERALYGDTTKSVRGEPVYGLEEIVRRYGGTEPGKIAALYAGSAYLLRGEVKKAEPYFELAAKAEAPLVLVGAYAGLAACREEAGKLREAAQLYERAATIGAPIGLSERYRFFAAYCYELAGDAQKAIALYRQLLLENEFSDFANDAKAGLARLGTRFE